jgi:predicted metal-dependent phosphotriesterase family hydrolase
MSFLAARAQAPFKTKARLVLHRNGWTDGFDKLEELLSSQAQLPCISIRAFRRQLRATSAIQRFAAISERHQ